MYLCYLVLSIDPLVLFEDGPTAWAIRVGPSRHALSFHRGDPFTRATCKPPLKQVALCSEDAWFVTLSHLPVTQFQGQHVWDRAGPTGFDEMIKFLKRSSVRVLLVEKTESSLSQP